LSPLGIGGNIGDHEILFTKTARGKQNTHQKKKDSGAAQPSKGTPDGIQEKKRKNVDERGKIDLKFWSKEKQSGHGKQSESKGKKAAGQKNGRGMKCSHALEGWGSHRQDKKNKETHAKGQQVSLPRRNTPAVNNKVTNTLNLICGS